MNRRNSHCSYCGNGYSENQSWPRECASCKQISYLNPTPVAVVLLPVDDGLLTIRRTIEPRKGMLALPGGFINMGESWQQAAARELFEETGITINADEVKHFDTLSAPDGTVLIFGLVGGVKKTELPAFVANEETEEMALINEPTELAFPLHTRVANAYFAQQQHK